jgi:hypothetical protein
MFPTGFLLLMDISSWITGTSIVFVSVIGFFTMVVVSSSILFETSILYSIRGTVVVDFSVSLSWLDSN